MCKGCGSFGYIKDPNHKQLKTIYKEAWHDSALTGRFAAGSTSARTAESLIFAVKASSNLGTCLDYGGGHGVLAEALLKQGASDVSVLEPFGSKPLIPEA